MRVTLQINDRVMDPNGELNEVYSKFAIKVRVDDENGAVVIAINAGSVTEAMMIIELSHTPLGTIYSKLRAACLHFFAGLKRPRALAAPGPNRVCHSALVGADVSSKKKGGDSFFFLLLPLSQVGNGKNYFAMSKQDKRSGLMQKRTLKVALLAVLAVILVLGFSTVALADQTWSDLPDTVTAKYGITDNQVAAISEGFPDGTLETVPVGHPRPVHQDGCGWRSISPWRIRPPRPSRTFPKAAIYYQYIEGAKAAGSGQRQRHHLQPQRPHHPPAGRRHGGPLGGPGERLSIWPPCTRPTEIAAPAGSLRRRGQHQLRDLKAEVAFAFDMGITTGDDLRQLQPAGQPDSYPGRRLPDPGPGHGPAGQLDRGQDRARSAPTRART